MRLGAGWRRAPVGVAAAVALATSMAGGLLTDIGPWYYALQQPFWKPPDWLFGPAWTLIYTLTAWSAVRCWDAANAAADAPAARRAVLAVYGLNVALNVVWSALFFTLKRPDWALAEVLLLGLSVGLLMVHGRRVPGVPWMLLPYLLWVSFASSVNAGVVWLNGPF